MESDSEWLDESADAEWRRAMFPGRRPRRPPTRPVVASKYQPSQPIPPNVEGELRKLHAVVKRLEEKQDAQAKALATVQSHSDAGYSADLFRQALASAVVNAAPSILNEDPFGAAAQFVPVVQNLKGGATSFASKPISTLAVPAIAFGIYALRQPRKPVIVTNRLRTARAVRVTVISPDGGAVYYTTDGSEPTKSSRRYADHIAIEPYKADFTLRVRAFLLLRASETAEVKFTKATWWERWILR